MYEEDIPPQLAKLRQMSDSSELDEQLYERFEAVWQHLDQSPGQRKAISRLISKVQVLPGILKSSHQDYPIALNQTWLWFSQQVKQFDPGSPSIAKSLMRWLNGYLTWRIRDITGKKGSAEISLDCSLDREGSKDLKLKDIVVDSPDGSYLAIGKEGGYRRLSVLDKYIADFNRTQVMQLGLAVEDYINRDPEGKLRNCHPKNFPDCNMQYLAQRFCLQDPPADKTEVALEVGVNYNTLVAHWRRNNYLLVTIGLELGYQPEQLKQYIEQDPDGKLRCCHLKNKPECNAQFLARKLLRFGGESPFEIKLSEFEQLTQELYAEDLRQVSEKRQTMQWEKWTAMIQQHWEKRCLPLIAKIALQQKYQPPEE